MKKISTLIAALLCIYGANAQRNCAHVQHQHQLEQADPSIVTKRNAIEAHTNAFINANKGTRALVTIPVVFHIVYNTATQNISDAQIQSQLDVLNADFARTNADWTSTPTVFQSLVGIPDIQFCLAKRDPNGNATTGIIRKSTTITSFSTNDNIKRVANGGSDAWPTSQYLNIWVGNISGGILGYAQFPGGPASTDGVVLNYTCTGTTGTAAAPFNLGRTGTHEVGHWLNLYHIWGDDGTACTGSDQVGDTPNQGDENYGTPAFPQVSCSNGPNGDMFMNYMDYVDDAAMFMFSTGQVSRMQALFATGGFRASLLTSQGCVPPTTTGGCTAPANLAASNTTTTSTTLSWGAITGAASYTLQYKLASATSFTTVSGITGTSYNLTGLTANSSYNWQVSTACATSNSVYTASTFTTNAVVTACSDVYEANQTRATSKVLPVNTTITASIGTASDVDWFRFSNTSAARNIKIDLTNLPADYDVKLFRNNTQVAISQNGGTLSEQIKYNNGSITTYYVNIYGYNGAFNANSCYSLTASLSATAWRTGANGTEEADVEQNINMEKIQGNLDVTIYPNPNNGVFNIDLLNLTPATEANVTIIDMMGKRVYNNTVPVRHGANGINVEQALPAGMYNVIVRLNDELKIVRFTVN
jgi:hypothetical protein